MERCSEYKQLFVLYPYNEVNNDEQLIMEQTMFNKVLFLLLTTLLC